MPWFVRGTLALAAALLIAGCSSPQRQPSGGATPAGLHNVTGFPLYTQSQILTARSFTQTVEAQASPDAHSVFTAGNGTYAGNEVIAASPASFSDLSAWLAHLSDSPPPGYVSVETGANPDEESQAQQYGVDYALFKKNEAGRAHGVLVVVMDPQRVNERFGKVLGMIAKYRALPDVMRAPIDNAAKARIGMTITQATQPDSPIGAALAALSALEHKDARGIVVIDAAKH